jgi:ubiquinone/menaquinone biosynthesis C-methylase UbiE
MTESAAPASRWDPDGEEARNLLRRAESLWNRDYVDRVLVPLLDLPQGARGVDVGTGFGALTFLLASIRPDLQITGVDPEAGLIEGAAAAASGMGYDQLAFVVADGVALPFDSGSLDLAMCQTVLTHVPDAPAIVAEMARVLRPGGVFFAAEWTDRALAAFGFDSVAPWTLDRAADTYRLTKAYSLGRAALGRGDDEAGIRAPILAREAGLRMVDVRLNDRVAFAIPPYATPAEQASVDDAREWVGSPAPDEAFVAWSEENLRAAGGDDADVARWVEVIDMPQLKGPAGRAIDDGTFAWVGGGAMILTIARKPDDAG